MIPFDVKGKRVLLLQGPMGPFFRRLANGLIDAGAGLVHKVNFNGGDRYYFPGGFDFTESLETFDDYLYSLIDSHRYDMVCLFGDCRPHHVVARRVCDERNVVVMAFEEGYLRPHFITVEPSGVNSNSTILRDPEVYRRYGGKRTHHPAEKAHFHTYPIAWWQSFSYGLFMRLHKGRYPLYRHHRELEFQEGLKWLAWDSKKAMRRTKDRRITAKFLSWVGDRFFVPLQLSSDYQVSHHSSYDSVRQFIAEVIHSFHENAASDAVLLFKHHPKDPYEDYSSFIEQETKRHGMHGRVLYCVNGHLPTILNSCTGVITINSTVGISALLHRRPLCVRGKAIYGIDGLVVRDLDEFMKKPWIFVPDRELFEGFRNYHLVTTQAAGNFHRVLFKGTKTGLLWPQETNFEKHFEKCSKRLRSERLHEPNYVSQSINENAQAI
jgi:capsule polysaccharide modification protein KpsS